ncbi:hypothetical protein BDN70DRAFT_882865 [Pholiota conissans]|uniref:MYND-type domain-containing protein n=1 Tax=Pholiota conissans TaxID=109636 RepID=A0A9P6CXY3_9AGAR|nr:hypothetical protein BDN70DRAFT_882865 [Pholiota conissans]
MGSAQSSSTQSCAQCQSNSNLQVCSKCGSVSYCNKECEAAHRETHKRSCEPLSASDATQNAAQHNGSEAAARVDEIQDGRDPKPLPTNPNQIWGVKLNHDRASNEQLRFVPEFFEPSHPIFNSRELCPFTKLYDIPIILFSPTMARGEPCFETRGGKKVGATNKPAVFLHIEPRDGFASFRWQEAYPGPCYAVRQDRKPLTAELLETMYEFHSFLISDGYFEEDFGRALTGITPSVFKKFYDKYWKEQKQNGRILPSLIDGSDGL